MGAELLLFLGVFLVGLAVFLFVSTLIAGDESASPLMWASSEKPKERSGLIRIARPFVHKFTVPIVRRYGFKNYREKLKRRIVEAGMKEELNDEEYIGLQIFLGIFAPGLIFMANVLFAIGYPWWLIFFFAVFGFFAPFLQTREAIAKRRSQVASDLPFVIDLLALSIAAGSDFMQALQKVVEKMDGGALADELQQVLRDLALGSSRSEALNGMAWRINMTEMTSLVATLVTADATGAPYATVLKQQSEQMRQNRFSLAEKLGAQASQKVFLPIVLFIIPAVFIVLFGPVLIQFVGFK